MELLYSPDAAKAMIKMPRHDAQALAAKLRQFAADPFAQHSFAKAMQGVKASRVRHGVWRAVCAVDGKRVTVTVVKIGRRNEVYR